MSVTLNVHNQQQQQAPQAIASKRSDVILEIIGKIAVGCLALVLVSPAAILLERSVSYIMTRLDPTASLNNQDAKVIWNGIASISTPLLAIVLKVAFLAYVVVIGPIFEEYLFRTQLHEWLKQRIDQPAVRVLANGFLFGLAHLSPFQGWANLPIFALTGFGGCVLSALREETGDIIAPSAAHILNNGLSMMQFLKG